MASALDAIEEELLERVLEVQRMRSTPWPDLGVPIPQNIIDFRQALTGETDRGCVLHAAGVIDNDLKELLLAVTVDDAKYAKLLFTGNGAVASTFSNRTKLAYMLGLIGEVIVRDIDLIRQIRNDFAHHPGHIRFGNGPIAQKCRSLALTNRAFEDAPRLHFCAAALGVLAAIHAATKRAQRPNKAKEVDVKAWKRSWENLMEAAGLGKKDT